MKKKTLGQLREIYIHKMKIGLYYDLIHFLCK